MTLESERKKRLQRECTKYCEQWLSHNSGIKSKLTLLLFFFSAVKRMTWGIFKSINL